MNWLQILQMKTAFDRVGVSAPPPVVRALEILEILTEHEHEPAIDFLSLTDDEIRDRATELSIRSHQGIKTSLRGMRAGTELVRDQLASEVSRASVPYLEEAIVAMQPKFDEFAGPLEIAAQEFGFTARTTADQVINLADERASAALRDARKAWQGMIPISRLRQQISELFSLSPTHEEQGQLFQPNPYIDFSVCFAAGNNWSDTCSYYIDSKPQGSIDWLALAAGGLHLNTTAEVREKQQRR